MVNGKSTHNIGDIIAYIIAHIFVCILGIDIIDIFADICVFILVTKGGMLY